MRLRPSTVLATSAAAAVLVGTGVLVAVTRPDNSVGAPAVAASAAPAAPAAVPTTAAEPPADRPAVTPKKRSKTARDRAVRRARAIVKDRPRAVHASDHDRFRTPDVVLEASGTQHVRFDRTYRGLDVLGGDFVMHVDKDGALRSATVAQSAPITVGIEPTISAEAAIRTAKRAFKGTLSKTASRLVIDASDGRPVLAWRIVLDGVKTDGLPSSLNVIVDATTGAIRRSYDDIHAAEGTGHSLHSGDVALSTTRLTGGSYVLTDPARGNGETRDARNMDPELRPTGVPITDPDNNWGNGRLTDRSTAAVDVHYGLQ